MNSSNEIQRLEAKQNALEDIIKTHKAQILGSGYCDVVLCNSQVESFIHHLTALSIIVEGINLWCHQESVKKTDEDCPQGIGKRPCSFGAGWLSELPYYEQIHMLDIPYREYEPHLVRKMNEKALTFLSVELKQRSYYSQCLVAGLWLHVPSTWR